MRSLEQHAPREVSKVLVGNKCDLEDDREVTEDMGRDLAEEYGMAFFETSAMTGHGVNAAFMQLARHVKQRMAASTTTSGSAQAGIVVLDDPDSTPAPAPPCSCTI
jgi:Ras-related protein Rab-8A